MVGDNNNIIIIFSYKILYNVSVQKKGPHLQIMNFKYSLFFSVSDIYLDYVSIYI